MKSFWQHSFIFVLAMLLGIHQQAQAQSPLPACDKRPHFIDPPWVNAEYYCAELVIHDESGGELGFTALATAPDGVLYATRPLFGEVLALDDTDADGLPDKARIVIEGLTLPNGLAYYEEALYISGGSHIYKWVDNELITLVDDLPSGGGFWTGGITIGADERVYVGVGAMCDMCIQTVANRGAILSFALDGSDQQVVATGLRQPNDLAFQNGDLWTVDSARSGLSLDTSYDELNRVVSGANFGWPYCIGKDNQPDISGEGVDCKSATPPALTFMTHSNPLGIAAYSGDAFPHLKDHFLVTMGGTDGDSYLNGYTLVTIGFDAAGNPLEPHIILPEVPGSSEKWTAITLQKIHYQASGFWQHHPYDVTTSREGWIYISVGGGTIWALRPR